MHQYRTLDPDFNARLHSVLPDVGDPPKGMPASSAVDVPPKECACERNPTTQITLPPP